MRHQISQTTRNYFNQDMLRFITCGSIDDGKSTLIGRLLSENNSLYEDQIMALEKISKGRDIKDNFGKEIDYSLLLDGLQAEIEQGITIDVAYRYFSTLKRNYIVADTPGHEQYTRNMATGASTADLAVFLIDATKGLMQQTKRHLFITNFMGIKNFIIAINKMDLVDYQKKVFEKCKDEYLKYAKNINVYKNITTTFIPVSALKGDNVSVSSKNMSWYKGNTLVNALDQSKIKRNQPNSLRLMVKYVNKSNMNFRSYCGLIVSGKLKVGDKIIVLPSKIATTVKSINIFDSTLKEAKTGDSVCICVKDDIDISRGDLIVKKSNFCKLSDKAQINIVWMDNNNLFNNKEYYFKFNNKIVSGTIKINNKIDINNSKNIKTNNLRINEIGNCHVFFNEKVPLNLFKTCKETGSFIMIDKITNKTSGAGIITSLVQKNTSEKTSNIFLTRTKVKREQRSKLKNQKGCVVWLTGLSGTGKSTIANNLEYDLLNLGHHTYLLDGDNVRHGLNKDIDFSDKGRSENIRRVAEVSKLMLDAGLIVITAFISPFETDRQKAKKIIGKRNFIEIFIDTPLEECIKRDPKKLYQQAIAGTILNFTGIGSKYEIPKKSDLIVKTLGKTPKECSNQILKYIREKIEN